MNWGHPERDRVVLLAGDAFLAAAALLLAARAFPGTVSSVWQEATRLTVYVGIYTATFYIFDLYDVRALNGIQTFTRLFTASIFGTCLLSLCMYVFQWHGLHPRTLGIAVAQLLASSLLWRRIYKRHRSAFFRRRATLFIGAAEDAAMLNLTLNNGRSPYRQLGFLRFREVEVSAGNEAYQKLDQPLAAAAAAGASSVLHGAATAVREQRVATRHASRPETESFGGMRDFGIVSRDRLESIVREFAIDTVVLRPNPGLPELVETLTELRFLGVRIVTMPDFCSQILEELPIDTLSDDWFTFAAGFHLLQQKMFRRIKRISDICFAGAGLIATLPISLVAALAVKLESPGPVLLRQWRVGWMEKPFLLLKFRSMRQDAETNGTPQWAASRDPRVTRVGRILRTLHIDEIPQMMNVLKGEMSFIGPRPERPEFVGQLKAQIPFYSLRHYVRPGITGWAQVNYPYGACVEDARRKLQYDLFYVRNASPTMDLRILLRTARVVLYRRGSR